MGSTQQSWEEIVSRKRTERNQLLLPYIVNDIDTRLSRVDQVHKRSELKDPDIQKVTDIDNIVILLQLLQKGDLTAEQVIKAYIKRCG